MLLRSSFCLALLTAVAGCSPAPLYLSAGNHKVARGAVTLGEIPRDAMGEPVWSAIRPLPGHMPGVQQQLAEGDADPPR